MKDLLVIGGGPVGLGTAIAGAMAGLDTVVLEPRAGAIDKACGEGLMPPAVRDLGRLGVSLPVSHPFLGIRYLDDRGHRAEAAFRGGPGLGVRRTVLSAAMAARAGDLGVPILAERATRLVQHPDHVEIDGHRARYVAVADGLASPIRHQLGLQLPPSLPPRVGIRRHFRTAPWSPWVEVHWADDCEAYVTPVAADQVGIAILHTRKTGALPDQRPPFDRWLSRFPELAAKLGEPCSVARGAGPFEQRVARRMVGRVLLVGDAAGYLDPLTGEGIRLGLASAFALVSAVQANAPSRYEADWWRITRSYRWMTGGLLMLARNTITRRLIVPTVARVPGLLRLGVGVLAG